MKHLLCLFALSLLHLSACRTVSKEADIVSGVTAVEKRSPLQLPCTYRTLNSEDPYPSVLVKWQDQIIRFTWKSTGEVTFEKNYKHKVVSHAYPSSGGLSGGASVSTVPTDPLVPAVPEDNTFEDIQSWFQKDCSKPY